MPNLEKSYSSPPVDSAVSGIMLGNSISFDVENIATENSIDVLVPLFSNKYKYADVEFWYRTDYGEKWMNDASISASTATFIKGNKLFRLPCSSSGYSNIIRWQYEDNGLTTGNNCQIKIVVIPSTTTFNFYGYYSIVENLYTNDYNEIEAIIPFKIIGIDNYGNYMCFYNNSFCVVDSNKDIILQYSGLQNVICCQQIYNDHYIFLDNLDQRIVEIDNSGNLVYQLQSVILFTNPCSFIYDEFANNVLLTDSGKDIVYEIAWDETNKGDIIWQHGTTGSGINELNAPTVSIYDSENRAIIYVADSGNSRIKKIDRSDFSDDITLYTYFLKDDAEITFNVISRMFSNKNNLIVVEGVMEQELFNENIKIHPALARALNTEQGTTVTKNNVEEYRNLLFYPVSDVVEGI